jgi:hypothetical protein
MRSDDLSTLFGGDDESRPGFRQGVVVSWNDTTWENVINVGGTEYTDLTVKTFNDTVTLVPGDVVSIQTFGNTWAIDAKLFTPPI